jgi:formate dehydrogenase maturation protein FdhE
MVIPVYTTTVCPHCGNKDQSMIDSFQTRTAIYLFCEICSRSWKVIKDMVTNGK